MLISASQWTFHFKSAMKHYSKMALITACYFNKNQSAPIYAIFKVANIVL